MTNVRLRHLAGPVLTVIGFFLAWEILCRALRVPDFVLPPPSLAIATLVSDWSLIWPNARQTLVTTLIGFFASVILGGLVGMIIGMSPATNRCLSPLLVAFNAMPKVALVPVLVLWFGIGEVPATLTACLLSFFPIAVNVAVGIATMEQELTDLLLTLGAKRIDIMLKAGVPHSLPYFFASLKVAITLAFVGSVISETVASNNGIGYLMLAASSSFRVPLVFASLLLVGSLGVAMYGIASWIEVKCTPWAEHHRTGMSYASGS